MYGGLTMFCATWAWCCLGSLGFRRGCVCGRAQFPDTVCPSTSTQEKGGVTKLKCLCFCTPRVETGCIFLLTGFHVHGGGGASEGVLVKCIFRYSPVARLLLPSRTSENRASLPKWLITLLDRLFYSFSTVYSTLSNC